MSARPKTRSKHPRIVFVIPEDWYFWSHRLPLAEAARDAGFEVVIATRLQNHEARIRERGLRPEPILVRRSGRNPVREVSGILDLIRLYRRERPVLVHHVTVKPVLYGSMAARIAGVPAVVNAIAGMGHVFASSGLRATAAQALFRLAYSVALRGSGTRVILQTESDRDLLVQRGLLRADRARVIRGAGVDVDAFTPAPEPDGPPIVLLAARLLWSKGIGDFVEAARYLAAEGRSCRMVLVGDPDRENPRAVPETRLAEWEAEGIVEWWGHRDDMPAVIGQASVVALPTYYGEGVPKVLLEAAASGRPVVTTNLPGCQDVVDDGRTGYVVPPQCPEELAAAIRRLLDDPALRRRMGAAAREVAVGRFSDQRVVTETLGVYGELLSEAGLKGAADCLRGAGP